MVPHLPLFIAQDTMCSFSCRHHGLPNYQSRLTAASILNPYPDFEDGPGYVQDGSPNYLTFLIQD